MRIAVFVSGGGTNLQAIIDRISSGDLHNVEISLVISSSETAFAIERSARHNIPCVVIRRKDYCDLESYDRAMLDALETVNSDLIVLAGFLSLLGQGVVRAFENRIINIHPSLIPSFCGPGMYGIRPHVAALQKGVKVSGATVHFVTEEYDEGPILLQRCIDVLQEDTPETLQQRIMIECEQVILPLAISLIADGRVCIDNKKAFILPVRQQEDGGKYD